MVGDRAQVEAARDAAVTACLRFPSQFKTGWAAEAKQLWIVHRRTETCRPLHHHNPPCRARSVPVAAKAVIVLQAAVLETAGLQQPTQYLPTQ